MYSAGLPMDKQRMPAGPDCEMASQSGNDPDEFLSNASHWSLEHDRNGLSRDISTVSGVEDGYAHASEPPTSPPLIDRCRRRLLVGC